jgi:WD40 repeat protein
VDSVQCVSFTPDGHQLPVMDASGEIVTLDARTGNRISSFQNMDPKRPQVELGTRLLCLSPDGSKLALSSASGIGVDLWNPITGKVLYSLPEENGSLYWLAWSPDSRRLAVARDDGSIAIWNLDTVSQILTKLGLNP